jgi:hypothetical protein
VPLAKDGWFVFWIPDVYRRFTRNKRFLLKTFIINLGLDYY